jgi:hypothetical protein
MPKDDPVVPSIPEKEVIPVPVPTEGHTPVVNEKGLRIIAIALSLAGVLLVAAGLWGFFTLRSVSRDNAKALKQIRTILNPTPEEYREQLKRGIQLCLREPECRELFPQIDPKQRRTALREIRQRIRRDQLLRVRARQRRENQRASVGTEGSTTSSRDPSASVPPQSGGGGGSRRPAGGGGGGGPPTSSSPAPSSGGGGTGGGGGGGSSPPPSQPNRPVVKTPEVQVPASPVSPPITVPSIEVPCIELRPTVIC